MLSHVILGVNDVPRAVEFYDAILGILGYDRRWIGETGAGYGTDDELGINTFWLTKPIDDKPHEILPGMSLSHTIGALALAQFGALTLAAGFEFVRAILECGGA